MADSCLLKILSGPHTGAEISLAPGEYTLGSDAECDIQLADAAVASQHLRIRVQQDGFYAAPLQGAVMYDGVNLPEGDTRVAFFKVLVLGGTGMCLGPADQPWPTVSLPELVTIPEPEAEEAQQVEQELPQASSNPSALAGIWQELRQNPWHLALNILLLMLVVIALGWGAHTLFTKPETLQEQRRNLIAQLDQAGFAHVTAELKGQTFLVSGRVADQLRKAALEQLAEQQKIPTSLDVTLAPDVAEELRKWLSSQDISLEVKATRGGDIIVSGFARSPQDFQEVMSTARKAVKHLGEVNASCVTYDQVQPELLAILGTEGLMDDLQVHAEPFAVAFTGTLGSSDRQTLASIRQRLSEMFAMPIPFSVQAAEAEERRPKQPGEIASTGTESPKKEEDIQQSVDNEEVEASERNEDDVAFATAVLLHVDPPAFVDQVGRVHPLGAILPGGYIVNEVSPLGVVIMKGNDMRFLAIQRR